MLWDSEVAQWSDDTAPYPLAYEIADAVSDAFDDHAFHVHAALGLTDSARADA